MVKFTRARGMIAEDYYSQSDLFVERTKRGYSAIETFLAEKQSNNEISTANKCTL